MTAGKSTKSTAKPKGSKLAVKKRLAVKINEADKWKPRTDSMKERKKPAPQLGSTASWLGALALFQRDYLKEFREKNPKDKSSRDAVFRKASKVWSSLSNSDKAPYEARSLAAALQYRKDVAKTVFYRKTWDLKLKLEVEMEKMNL
ncbi:hypothetical protein QYE76_069725 [Lolium multiflorum]|uniref:HMG box domain-containing protein n=1 Tax=Lolium multiflorum TaxID=4521 RepID=A0AAD8WDS5_LOLMU|nr:hypothetical protein QYE76_069725 [Lolium multiflorum]